MTLPSKSSHYRTEASILFGPRHSDRGSACLCEWEDKAGGTSDVGFVGFPIGRQARFGHDETGSSHPKERSEGTNPI